MAISTGGLFGHSQVGVHLSIIGNVLFHPSSIDAPSMDLLQSSFDMEMHPFSVGGSALLGSLLRGNKNGIAVADIAFESELEELTSFGDVVVMQSGVNAAGNLIECNDFGAIVSPMVPDSGLEMIEDVLGVPSKATTVAHQDSIGSLLVANNNGILAHPDVTPTEISILESTLKVSLMVGTVTFGSPFVGAGCTSSDSHALVGAGSTGPELNRIEDALGLI